MPAEVETGAYNGERGLPWHGLGTSVTGYSTAADILRVAQLDWEVERQPIFLANGIEVPDKAAIVRLTDSKPLGVIGNRYVPAQNVEVLTFLDELIGEGQATYDSAWSLRGGKTVAVSAELTNRINIGEGEDVRTFLTASTSHDGNGQIRFTVSPVRVVCMNTLAMATARAKFTWTRKHTTNALSRENMSIVRDALGIAGAYQEWLEETAAELLALECSGNRFEQLARQLLLPDEAIWEAELEGQQAKRVEDLITLWSTSANLENIRNTRWGALNAVAEYADHHARYSGKHAVDNRTKSILIGRAAEMKGRAYELLVA